MWTSIHADVARYILAFGSVAVGVTVASLIHGVTQVVRRRLPTKAQSHEFEELRRMRLRSKSAFYRWFEPFVVDVAMFLERQSGKEPLAFWIDRILRLSATTRSLNRGGDTLPWRPAEFTAVALLKCIMLFGCMGIWVSDAFALGVDCCGALVVTCLYYYLEGRDTRKTLLLGLVLYLVASDSFSWQMNLLWSVAISVGLYFVTIRSLQRRAEERLKRITQRLPYTLDLIGLTLECGATLTESLDTAVAENQDHPLGQELGRVSRDTASGKLVTEAWTELAERLQNQEVFDVATAAVAAQDLGTPLSDTYLRLAEQLRLKRHQAIDEHVQKAEQKMAGPGMLIAMACMAIIVAPLIISMIRELHNM